MLPIQSYRDLRVWREAMELAELCYKHTANFPKCEMYGLQSQIRRAAVSVASNIAEGHSRGSLAAYLNHLSISLGSQAELETQIELSLRLIYLKGSESAEILELAGRVGRRLHALMGSLQRGSTPRFPIPNGKKSSSNAHYPVPRTQSPEPSTQNPVPSTQFSAPSPQHLAPRTHKEVRA